MAHIKKNFRLIQNKDFIFQATTWEGRTDIVYIDIRLSGLLLVASFSVVNMLILYDKRYTLCAGEKKTDEHNRGMEIGKWKGKQVMPAKMKKGIGWVQ